VEVLIELTMPVPETARPDPERFAEALAVLERERPARRAVKLFQALNWCVWAALAGTALYIIQVLVFAVTLSRAQPIAIGAAILYLLVVSVALLNLGFFNQLRRAATLERKLAPSWRKGLQAKYLARRHPVATRVALRLLSLGGWLALGFGVIGLVVELLVRQGAYPAQLGLAVVLTFLGVVLIVVPWMSRGLDRLKAIGELRRALKSGETSAYDTVAEHQRDVIKADRERTIKAEATARTRGYRYQESRAVRDAKEALASGELVEVLAHLDRLVSEPPSPGRGATSRDIQYDSVGDTELELGYSIDHETREVRLISLAQQGLRPAPGVEREAESPGYMVNLPSSVRDLAAAQRMAVDDIVAKLAEDPAGVEHLASAEGGQMVRRHPSPPLEVTYSIDNEQKTVNVVHLSAPIPALRTLFISYSHSEQDRAALTKVMDYVRQLEVKGLVNIWYDELIRAGDRWNDKINAALESAHAALLLVSQDFINSRFINEEELPRLLKRAANGLTKIFWIPVRHSTVFTTHQGITAFQALLDPAMPLNKREKEGDEDQALLEIYEKLRKALVE
jgi:hypothetical protein